MRSKREQSPDSRQPTPNSSHDSHNSHESHDSHDSPSPTLPILLHRGDYRTLLSYQKTEVIYEITWRFTHRHLGKGDRTVDQMIQAARSGKQNILEGSKAGATSREAEIKLTNVARASLQGLLEDYLDYLRVRDLPVWDKSSPQARFARDLGRTLPMTFETWRPFVETRPPAVIANLAICLIHQANYLLDRQLKRLEADFLEHGGIRERMTQARLQARTKKRKPPFP